MLSIIAFFLLRFNDLVELESSFRIDDNPLPNACFLLLLPLLII